MITYSRYRDYISAYAHSFYMRKERHKPYLLPYQNRVRRYCVGGYVVFFTVCSFSLRLFNDVLKADSTRDQNGRGGFKKISRVCFQMLVTFLDDFLNNVSIYAKPTNLIFWCVERYWQYFYRTKVYRRKFHQKPSNICKPTVLFFSNIL